MSGSALLAISGFRMVGRPPMAAKIRGVLHVCKESTCTCERMEGRDGGKEGGGKVGESQGEGEGGRMGDRARSYRPFPSTASTWAPSAIREVTRSLWLVPTARWRAVDPSYIPENSTMSKITQWSQQPPSTAANVTLPLSLTNSAIKQYWPHPFLLPSPHLVYGLYISPSLQ